MKKNGEEIRKNGNKIRRIVGSSGHVMYHVFRKIDDVNFTESANGPWDYLANARRDADGADNPPFNLIKERKK